MLINFNNSYITAFAMTFSYPLQCFYLLNCKILERATRPESRMSTSYGNALWTNGISWISASSTKPCR